MPPVIDVAVVGGGITGLAAAYELHRRHVPFVLLEASGRLGGVIHTEAMDRFVIDAGPDSFLTLKPAAQALCDELGLRDRQVAVKRPGTAFVLRDGRLRPLPPGGVLGVPTRFTTLATNDILSVRGRLRAAADLVLPRGGPGPDGDESIAAFVRRRFGKEAAVYIADPLLAGIHAGDADSLSVRALFPQLAEAEARHRSVIYAFRARRSGVPEGSPFRSFEAGMDTLVHAIRRALPPVAIRSGSSIERIERSATPPFSLIVKGVPAVAAQAIILAVPAHAAADLLEPLDAGAAAICRSVRYRSTVTVVLAYPRAAVRHPLHGVGFVVPRAERSFAMLAATWVSSKWPGRAPPEHVLLRVFFGGARNPSLVDWDDRDLLELAHHELARVLHVERPSSFGRVYRWPRATPQYEVGHLLRMRLLHERLERLPGILLAGSGFHGIGIPDCIADGRAVAARVAHGLHTGAA